VELFTKGIDNNDTLQTCAGRIFSILLPNKVM